MKEVGSDIADVQGVMVTHIHPDHYGLAGRIREASGAWISLHPADAELIHDRYDEPDDLLDRVAAALRRMGAPAEEFEPLQNAAMPVRQLVDAVVPDILFEDGARPEVPGWDLTAIWTPGHSPGHLCFYEATQELMLSGDHVLPRITPNIPYHPQAGANPLGDYLTSLDKLEPYEVARCCRPTSTASTTCTPAWRSCASTTGSVSPRSSPFCGKARTPPGTWPRT